MPAARRTIEIFSAGCSICETTIQMVRQVAGSGHDIQIRNVQQREAAERAGTLGVRTLPAVAIDGRLAACCAGPGPDEHAIREALQ